ncbi:2-C-methyl-D-erythritol 4-phosphate cytidylyltransferase [Pseudoalteromonas tunicata]|jgi:2-C-methyl-D-erythritol 4-phosphate cytidylyltransferase|uniref:2-C-methyl-D-erythritol 4-phosphate cytidylyltransferase n=1 Tax=Pseudoalteromonas tunicata D2 TaxID=87626 RepID=A4C6Z7_9GAMM|nr:2-C-methyl-D-erythritol 4-phosphate cytidylyltransferase [Pseudoalteromonas tunicata]ATC95721.1 2-C-methyl-D-erythritol 4-phosphate cytidylyltransferase [Pseudoalteromonas tunicata]AXT31277.1 2-C-methyl-D-erythritol 4-phosphate cytidylyltransferase [Pseudoalteromonas tunicata]EAR29751.1 2-C-methyl-D-erythritol 4-phosphate cytidylyltransferase (4-diphosphocytidyl-2C-methyl-D-erythritol synthase) [Pseudoalteromonas tunicata D2]MDP4985657.1 2-C-methyl-D-erythritol 4-phosphate cytidylyltransfera
MKQVKIAAIVPAAGVGSRMQSALPKQYIKINQQTVLEHTLNKLLSVAAIEHIMVAISPDDMWFGELGINDEKITCTEGGAQRANTVLNALTLLKDQGVDWVLVHDAARPLVHSSDIELLIDRCLSSQTGGILASKVKDTIKQGGQFIEATVPRDALWQALTPQMFQVDLLFHALTNALNAGFIVTDEASAMEHAQHPVMLIAGRSDNIKITTPEDLILAEFYLSTTRSLETQ